jgi:5-methyltetrahydrofolate--homocysteine methyltransferase
MMNLLELVGQRVLLGDGAMGTMLQAQGMKAGACPDGLNLENPELVGRIHAAYRQAGADYLETNTFGANRLRLTAHGLEREMGEIIARGVEAARGAAGDACLIAGSVGPTGALLEPCGDTPEERVLDAFLEVGRFMESAGVDFFLVETMADTAEAVLAVRALREVSKRPIVATSVFSKGAKGFRTMMGMTAEDVAIRLTQAGADFVGTNCCSGMAEATGIMSDMRRASTAAIIAQPNAGLPAVESGNLTYPETPAAMAQGLAGLLSLGVRMVGGCCGTTPGHIEAMAAALGRR